MPHIHRLPIVFAIICIGLSACAAPTEIPILSPTITATQLPTASPTETPTFTPTPEPTANPEDAYYQSLTAEQQALFDQTKDMTGEGFTRQFLAEQGLTSYLAYYDTDGEVAFVWNFEQGKPNPALKIENNLLINETSGSHIIWNPELNRVEAQKTLADYFRYARARVIAGANHVELGNTLESALANPLVQRYLEEGRRVTLLPTSGNYANVDGSPARFSVPAQKIFISGETPIVFRTVQELDENMVVIAGITNDQRRLRGYSYEQNSEGVLLIKYHNEGPEDLASYEEHADLIFSRRLAMALQSMFLRAEVSLASGGAEDMVTKSIIFSGEGLLPKNPLVIYSQTR